MYNSFLTANIDLAEIVTVLFTLFFFGLVIYLRREDRREGFPLEDDQTGRLEPQGSLIFNADPKTFILPDGRGTVMAPDGKREAPPVNARRTARADGSPIEPVGDPMLAGVGPGSYAQRAKHPDMMNHGGVKIAPLRAAPGFSVEKGSINPVGLKVVGKDKKVAGVITEVWVDRGEHLIRYLEAELSGSGRHVLIPMTMASVNGRAKSVDVTAILSTQFANVPALANPDQITFDEEERVTAYYGGGWLYATPARSEPIL